MKLDNYKKLVKDGGSRKILLFAGVAIVGVIVYAVFFSSPSDHADPSRLRQAPQVNDDSLADEVSPHYRDALQEADRQRIEEARQSGGSVMPSLIGGSSDQRLQLFEEEVLEEEEARPLELPSREVQPIAIPKVEPPPPPTPTVRVEPPPPPPPPPPAPVRTNASAEAPPPPPPPPYEAEQKEQMMAALSRLTSDNRRSYGSASTAYFYSPQGGAEGQSGGGSPDAGDGSLTVRDGAAPSGTATAADARSLLPLPGEILYAELVSRANSDAPGPVLARVLEGPLAGSTVLGQFRTGQGALVIEFNSMTVRTTRDGEEFNQNIPIQTVAVDVEHIGTALATDVDNHLFERIAMGFATSFIEGMGDAIVNSGNTRIDRADGSSVSENESLNTQEQVIIGAGRAAEEVGDILSDFYGNRPPTIIVESGTPIGLLFL